MKLNISFKNLNAAVTLMAPEKKGDFNLAFVETSIEKLDLELASGKDVELKDVDVDSGLLSYKGRQVLLYIKDHGSSVQNVIRKPETGNKFHVADCSKLKSMRSEGRFERYVVINDTSGEFPISGSSYCEGQQEEGKARLKICKFCLGQLNYQGYSSGSDRNTIFDGFDMAEFFATYSSFFPHMPSRQAETAETGYSENWTKVSSHYRVDKNFTCEQCDVNLRSHRHLLHVHHVSGVKSDNRPKNLKALCIDCHSKQPMHSHMAVSHSERQLINKLRNEQGLLEDLGNWQCLFDFADPGLHGVLHACKDFGTTLPEVGFYISDSFGDLAAKIELAWPKHKFGIAISTNDIEDANNEGWHVLTANEFLADYRSQAGNLRW
ncbi:HNH endonuclease [Vibrio sp. RE88]|uniref:HNH endonuclease n=1 Tax=Vibrio sp. RE88 TaxID=2607610 RepID=UPI0014933B70|nr:HNH endonuclease [Vibrio sp. RE88]NOH63468.1 HNH endonuclease [Vibrio sp. RE88]